MKRDIKKIVAGIIASLIITSNNTFAVFASNSEYLDDAANAYIEQIKDQDTLTKTKSILSYASKMDGTTENCVTAALNVYNLCEAAGIRCHVRTSANSDSFGAQNHVNNVIDVEGTSYIADVSMGSKHIIFFKATEYKYFYKDTGFSDGNFVYRTGSDGNYIVSECLKWDYSDVVIPTQTVNPLTGETVKVTAVEQTEFVDSNAVRRVTIPDGIVTLRERAFYNLKSLEKVTLGTGITALPAHCFDGCEKLSDINLDNVISYDDESLTGTSLSSVTVNCNATFLAGSFNSNKSLVSITLPDNLISIPKYMLADCTNLVDFKLPTATTEIKDMAFAGCTKLELTVPDTVVTFGRNCFEDVKMVYCTSNSACAKYCEENGVKYKLTDVAPPNANDFEVTLSENSFTYSGAEHKPVAKATYKGKKIYGRPATSSGDAYDFEYSYENNVEAGTAYVLVTGLNDYTGTKKVPFTIEPLTLTSKSSRINFADGSMGQYKCTGSEIKPKINVFENDHDTRLTDGKDYKVSYSDNVNAGTGTIKVTFMGNYTGSISKTFKITPAHQHTFGSWKITKAPTCTTDGEQKRSCTSKDCGHYTETATIPAKGHSYKITSEANPCTGGKVTYTCSKCGDSYTEDVAAQGHKYVDTVVAPTCTTGGYTLHTCSVCKKSYKDNETQPTGHKYITNTVEATCETDGYTEEKCSNCDYYTKTIIPKKGHTPSSEWTVIKQPTCSEAGEQVRYCTTCNKIIERKSIDKLAHTPADEWIITKQPTCAEFGEQVRYCTICGEVAEKQEITKLPHTSSDWIIDKEAAPGIAGSMHTECTVCHERLETATIPALARIDISEADATLSTSIYEYDGGYMKPGVVVKLNDTLLVAGKDYTVSYINNKKVGTATVIVNGIVQYTGSVSKTFTINPAKQNIQKLETRYGGFFVDWAQKGSATGYEIQYATNYGFTNAETKRLTANKPDTVTISGLYRGRNYFVRVRSYTIVRGSTYYGEWSPIKNVVTASKNMSSVSISNISTKSFTGKAIAQSAKLKYKRSTLKNGRDYTVSYSSNKNVGTATIKFTGKGSYGGVVTKTFKINPAKQNIQKLKSKSRSFFIDWAQKGSATGYEIQYATNSKFRGAKKVTVTNNKTDKKTISKLSGKKKYYVRVRSYTTVKGKKYYGAWSSTKSVTTKK
jgi:hypothetical protein